MMDLKIIDLYHDEYIKKQFERKSLFGQIQKKYSIQTALYPGSYVHITPSFFIPEVVYVDSFKNANKFFSHSDVVARFIENNKTYQASARFQFIYNDYQKPLALGDSQFDLLISQWAGQISQSCKRYLKSGGILLANNSHADAGLAYLDPDYQLDAIVNHAKGKFTITENGLETYFIPKNDQPITFDMLLKSGKGISYSKSAYGYIFRKI